MLPPTYKTGPGRLKKLRNKKPDEDYNKGRTQRSYYYIIYGIHGHNAISCISLVVDPETQKIKVFNYGYTMNRFLLLWMSY